MKRIIETKIFVLGLLAVSAFACATETEFEEWAQTQETEELSDDLASSESALWGSSSLLGQHIIATKDLGRNKKGFDPFVPGCAQTYPNQCPAGPFHRIQERCLDRYKLLEFFNKTNDGAVCNSTKPRKQTQKVVDCREACANHTSGAFVTGICMSMAPTTNYCGYMKGSSWCQCSTTPMQ